MQVLVTGASGYVGSHVVADLVRSGHTVRGLVRNPDKARRVLGAHDNPPIDLIEGDMTDATAVGAAIAGCDAVVHTAAVVALDRAGGAAAFEANQLGAQNVLGGASRAGTEVIVHISSAAVFSLADGAPVDETTPLSDLNHGYGASKVAIERFVRGMQAAGAPLTLLYPVGIYGGIPTELDQTHQALAYWVNDATLETSTGINVVDVRDVATAAVRIVDRAVVGERFVVCSDFLPWDDMGDFLEDLLGGEVARFPIPGRALRALGVLGDAAPSLESRVPFPLTREAMMYATRMVPTDGHRAAERLDFTYTPARTTMLDALRWLADEGHLDQEWPGLTE